MRTAQVCERRLYSLVFNESSIAFTTSVFSQFLSVTTTVGFLHAYKMIIVNRFEGNAYLPPHHTYLIVTERCFVSHKSQLCKCVQEYSA